MNPHDLSELLYRLGYYVDDQTGEVMIELNPCGPPLVDKFLTTLAVQGKLIMKRNPEFFDTGSSESHTEHTWDPEIAQ